ncbi:hypothetical protein HC031_15370 [Planosporangium thailandense]|uniref:Uncharacterized protein n=1 Tax=Planosporangium thailandense TaxID=765197 RepID=A0ABX0XZ27_9ACTN|nr:hypothetical protein [Planosporangium thailandense]NJC71081.1 hypothetical protein [Planosporangium thailandense]
MNVPRPLFAAFVLVAAGVVGPGVAAGTAAAASSHLIVETPRDLAGRPRAALLETTGFAPGRSDAGTVAVRNDSDAPARLTITATDVRDDDNGCTRAERLVDNGCGPGQGELGSEVVVSLDVARDSAGPYTPIWQGAFASLRRGVVAGALLAAHERRVLRLAVRLPIQSGNETQTDRLGFTLDLTLEGDFGTETGTVPGSPLGGGPNWLPVTGLPAAVLLALSAGVGLLLAGVGLFVAGRWRGVRLTHVDPSHG